MPLVDFVSVVELAKVFRLAVVVMSRGMGVEIAHAEMWTAARLNCGGVDRPVGSRRRGMTGADAQQGDHDKQCHSVHRSTPFCAPVCTRQNPGARNIFCLARKSELPEAGRPLQRHE